MRNLKCMDRWSFEQPFKLGFCKSGFLVFVFGRPKSWTSVSKYELKQLKER